MDNSHKLFLENKFKEVSKLIPKYSKVLDIGCNDGSLRNYLNCCDYFGIDINKFLINKLIKSGFSAKVVDLNKEDLPFEEKYFDFVLILDVLEHILNPKKLLIDSKKKLNFSGKIIVTLPNDYHILNKLRFLFNNNLTEDPFSPYGHLHYFPIKTGEDFLKKMGFKILLKKSIAPEKPSFLPKKCRNFLGKFFPQIFARDILYVLETN